MGWCSLNEKCHGTWCRRAYYHRSVSGGARCFLSSLVRRSRPPAPTEPFQTRFENASVQGRWDAVAAVPVGYVARVFTGSCSVEYFGVCRVFMVFMVIQQSPQERGGGTTARTEWRNDIPS